MSREWQKCAPSRGEEKKINEIIKSLLTTTALRRLDVLENTKTRLHTTHTVCARPPVGVTYVRYVEVLSRSRFF